MTHRTSPEVASPLEAASDEQALNPPAVRIARPRANALVRSFIDSPIFSALRFSTYDNVVAI
jgi:hypothetical protein